MPFEPLKKDGFKPLKKSSFKEEDDEVYSGPEQDPGLFYKFLRATDAPKEAAFKKVLQLTGKDAPEGDAPLPGEEFLKRIGVPELGSVEFGGGRGVKSGYEEFADKFQPTGEKVEFQEHDPRKVTGRDVAGFAADVALDPVTYLTGGTSSVAKQVGKKFLSSAGKKALKKAAQAEAEVIAKQLAEKGLKASSSLLEPASQSVKQTAEQALQSAGLRRAERAFAKQELPKKFLDLGGIKFAGKTIIPGEPLKKGLRKAGEVVESLPVVGEPLKNLKRVAKGTLGSRTANIPEEYSQELEKFYEKQPLLQGEVSEKIVDKTAFIPEQKRLKLEKALAGEVPQTAKAQKEYSRLKGMVDEGLITPTGHITKLGRETVDDALRRAEDRSKDVLAKKLAEKETLQKGLKKEAAVLGGKRMAELQRLYRAEIDDLLDVADSPVEALKELSGRQKSIATKLEEAKKIGLSQDVFNKILKEEVAQLPQELRESAHSLRQYIDKIGKKDKRYGLLKRTIPNYVPRKYKDLNLFSKASTGPGGPYVKSLGGFAKQRKIGTTAEAEQFAKSKGGELIRDIQIPVAERAIRSEKARMAVDLENRLKSIYKQSLEKQGRRAGKASELKLPQELQQHLDSIRNRGFSNEYVKYIFDKYDKFLNFWKGSVTSIHPAFHARNYISNKGLMALGAGLKSISPGSFKRGAAVARGKAGTLSTELGEEIPYDMIRKEAVKRGVERGFYGGDVTETLKQSLDEAFYNNAARDAGLLKKGMLRGKEAIQSAGKAVGEHIERLDRMQLFTEFVRQGLDFDQAAKMTKKYLFDYSNLTDFEKNVMKRVLPFYTFKRKSFELFGKELFKQPRYFNGLNDFITFLQGEGMSPEEMDQLPHWMKNRIIIKTGENSYLTGLDLGFTDLFSSVDDPKKMASDVSPLLKVPGELLFNKNLFFDKPIAEYGESKARGIPKFIKDSAFGREILGVYKDEFGNYKTKHPYLLHVINSLPSSRVASTLESFDQENIRPGEMPWLKFLTGFNTTHYDQGFLDWINNQRLEEDLKNKGLGREYKKFYLPKELKYKVPFETRMQLKYSR